MPYELVEEPEGIVGSLGRGVARTVARAGEAIAGAPGDIASGILGLGNLAAQKITGNEIPGVSAVQNYIPGSDTLKKQVTERITGDYLKPQSGTEEFIDTIVGDIASLMVPGSIATKGGRAALKGIGSLGAKELGKAVAKQGARAIGSHAIGKGVEELTGSPLAGGLAKGATLVLSSTAGGRSALKNMQKEKYTAAEQSVPRGQTVQAGDLKSWIKNTRGTVSKSDMAEKDFITERLKATEKNINRSGSIGVKELMQLRKDANAWIFKKDIAGQSKRYVGALRDRLNDKLSQYGQTNPEFIQNFKAADDITRGIESGGKIQKFLNENVSLSKALTNYKPLSYGAYGLYYLLGKPHALGAILAGSSTSFASKYLGQIYNLLKNSEQARTYYADVLKKSATGDVTGVVRSIKAFDQYASKYEKSNSESPGQEPQSSQARYELL